MLHLLVAVEEWHTTDFILGAINVTFIALIPKKENPNSFLDYMLISLRNYVYKMISKLIAHRLKPILSKHITEEQFGFIEGR